MIATISRQLNKWLQNKLARIIYPKRRQHRLDAYHITSLDRLPVMSVDCEEDFGCSNEFCHHLKQIYGGFYSRLYKIDCEEDQNNRLTMHGIDLTHYQNFYQYKNELGRRSSFFLRHVKKAAKSGYFVELFNPKNHSIDMVNIHRSLKIRSFGLMMDAWLIKPERFGGVPDRFSPMHEPDCVQHWEQYMGVFINQPGYLQGSIIVNKRLVGYARLHRIGNMLAYKDFIGDGQFVNDGVMKLLHTQIIEWILTSPNQWVAGICNVAHGSIERGSEGLFFWKKKALFSPYKVKMNQLELPADFDAKLYLSLNPDVRHSRLTPAEHYKIHGRHENRLYQPNRD